MNNEKNRKVNTKLINYYIINKVNQTNILNIENIDDGMN